MVMDTGRVRPKGKTPQPANKGHLSRLGAAYLQHTCHIPLFDSTYVDPNGNRAEFLGPWSSLVALETR